MKFARVLIACILALGIYSSAPNRIVRSNVTLATDPVDRLMAQTDGKAVIGRDHATGLVEFIGTSLDAPIQASGFLPQSVAPELAGMEFAREYGALFGLQDPVNELTLEKVSDEKDGASFVRYQQVYQGIPVLGGELLVQLDGMKRLLSLSGKVLPKIELATTPGISAADARQTAFTLVAKEYQYALDQLVAAPPSLWIYQPSMMGGKGIPVASLVWRVEVTTQDLQPVNELVLVDAQKGAVRLNFNQIDDALYRRIYDNHNNPSLGLPGALARVEGQGNNPVADVNNAYTFAGDTYNFYKNNFGRDSLDGKGMQLISTTRYCPGDYWCPFDNAFWNGAQMVYGEGYASADDVVGHEMTHGVTSFTSNLFYYMQPGALNEGLSDVMGEFIDLTNGQVGDTPSVRWLMGEDLPILGALRDMKDPSMSSDPSPDRMTSSDYACGSNGTDHGGVHINSAVLAKAAYLIADGDTFNGQTITGIGIPKASQIFYKLESKLLTTASDYEDVYNLLPQACLSLVGSNGITQSDCDEVTKAVIATEMNQQPAFCAAPDAPMACPNDWQPFTKWYDGLEKGAGGWNFNKSSTDPSGYLRWQLNSPYVDYGWDFPYQGTKYLYADDDPPAAVEANAVMKNGVSLTGGMGDYYFLHFAHLFEIPYSFTGGVVEYELNGNGAWTTMASLPVMNGPDVLIDNQYGNPLGGSIAFSGVSNGYMSTRYDLSSLHNNTIRFRFRIGIDPDLSQLGWYVDNVHIYSCVDPATLIYKELLPTLWR